MQLRLDRLSDSPKVSSMEFPNPAHNPTLPFTFANSCLGMAGSFASGSGRPGFHGLGLTGCCSHDTPPCSKPPLPPLTSPGWESHALFNSYLPSGASLGHHPFFFQPTVAFTVSVHCMLILQSLSAFQVHGCPLQ